MRKSIYTLNVDNYAPDICKLTYPLLKRYAQKIGAEFHVIGERKYPKLSPMMEKLQIHDIARERGDDWILYIDSDCLVHPDMMDVTEILPRDTVLCNGVDFASNRYEYDDYFRRDGRHIASCGWFTVASSWTVGDLFRPLDDLSYEDAVRRIKPFMREFRAGIKPDHLIDDFILSRNVARFGLKHRTFRDLLKEIGQVDVSYLWHEYTMTEGQKLTMMKKVLTVWTGEEFK